MAALTAIHTTGKNHSFHYMYLCRQKEPICAFLIRVCIAFHPRNQTITGPYHGYSLCPQQCGARKSITDPFSHAVASNGTQDAMI